MENKTWGYDRVVGALAGLGHVVSDQTVENVLARHGIPLAPERKKTTTWKEFIRTHRDVLAATDFFTTEVWTKAGLVTYVSVRSWPSGGRPPGRRRCRRRRCTDGTSTGDDYPGAD
jgi:hypothetical protein